MHQRTEPGLGIEPVEDCRDLTSLSVGVESLGIHGVVQNIENIPLHLSLQTSLSEELSIHCEERQERTEGSPLMVAYVHLGV